MALRLSSDKLDIHLSLLLYCYLIWGNKSLFDGSLTFHIIKFKCLKCKKEYLDLEEAQKRFEIGPENIFVSNSHAACPNCYQARMDEFNRLDKIKI